MGDANRRVPEPRRSRFRLRFGDGAETGLTDEEARAEVFGDEPEPEPTDEERAERARWADLARKFRRDR